MGKVSKGPCVEEQPPTNTNIKFTLLLYLKLSVKQQPTAELPTLGDTLNTESRH